MKGLVLNQPFLIANERFFRFPTYIYQKITRNNLHMSTESIQSEIAALEKQLTGDMFKDMEIKDKIHNLKMKLSGTRPMNSEIECIGCGS